MAVSGLERDRLLFKWKERREKKLSEKKATKKFLKAFSKINRETSYKYYTDEENLSYYNLLMCLTYLEKLCIAKFGKKFKPYDVESAILQAFDYELTYRAAKTFDKVNKLLRKTNDKRLQSFIIKSLNDGNSFTDHVKKSEEKNLYNDWEVLNHD